MVIASKKMTKRKGLISSNRHRNDCVKLTSYEGHNISTKDPMYKHLYKIIDHEKKKNGGKIPRGFIPKLTRKYEVYTFLNAKGLTKRYARFCKTSKFLSKFIMVHT